MNIIVVGATGLTASSFLRHAVSSDNVKSILAFSRSPLASVPEADKLKSVVQPADEWAAGFPGNADVLFSGVSTTRAAAGGVDKQKLVDHDLQVELARQAKEKGCSTFVLISSAGASASSRFAYFKLKGEIEEDIVKIGFRRVLILRPGALLGNRDKKHPGFLESVVSPVMTCLHRSRVQRFVGYPIYGDEIAVATLKLLETLPDGVHTFESKELLDVADSVSSSLPQ